jgi:hypothetical protein
MFRTSKDKVMKDWFAIEQGGELGGACIVFQTWCLGKKGPLFVSVFGPVQTVCAAILSAAVLGKMISLGSLAGILLMFTGLYLVLWAKRNETNSLAVAGDDGHQSQGGAAGVDAEKAPLLLSC